MNLKRIKRQVKQTICFGIAVLVVCSGLMFGWSPAAIAAPDVATVRDPFARGIDQVAGEATVNQIEGQATEDLGKVQRQVDQATSQIDGAVQQAKGRAQKDIGRTQQAVEEVTDAAQESAEGILDAAKDLLN